MKPLEMICSRRNGLEPSFGSVRVRGAGADGDSVGGTMVRHVIVVVIAIIVIGAGAGAGAMRQLAIQFPQHSSCDRDGDVD